MRGIRTELFDLTEGVIESGDHFIKGLNES